jgi:hypothetical protein
VLEGGDRVAGHAFGADDQRHAGRAALDLLAGLPEQLEAGAADALHHDGRHFHGHSGIQADVARQHELLEVPGAMLPAITESTSPALTASAAARRARP